MLLGLCLDFSVLAQNTQVNKVKSVTLYGGIPPAQYTQNAKNPNWQFGPATSTRSVNATTGQFNAATPQYFEFHAITLGESAAGPPPVPQKPQK